MENAGFVTTTSWSSEEVEQREVATDARHHALAFHRFSRLLMSPSM
jgi:hypothetical protein